MLFAIKLEKENYNENNKWQIQKTITQLNDQPGHKATTTTTATTEKLKEREKKETKYSIKSIIRSK